MDLAILWLTTLPLRVLATFAASVMLVTCLLVQYSFHTSDISLDLAQQMNLIQLTSRLAHAKVKLFLQETQKIRLELFNCFLTQFLCFHYITVLVTKVVAS